MLEKLLLWIDLEDLSRPRDALMDWHIRQEEWLTEWVYTWAGFCLLLILLVVGYFLKELFTTKK